MKSNKNFAHYYVYCISFGEIHYDRTVSTDREAKKRCAELRLRKEVTDAIYTIGRVVKGAFV